MLLPTLVSDMDACRFRKPTLVSDMDACRASGEDLWRIFRDVYVPAALPLTHEVRCQGAALVLPLGR
jgi:hypothetical protein